MNLVSERQECEDTMKPAVRRAHADEGPEDVASDRPLTAFLG